MNKHTPGPWHVGGPYPMITVCYVFDSGSIDQDLPTPPHWEPICLVWDSRDVEAPAEVQANAHLIAAAPDLYHAVKGYDPDLTPLGWLVALVGHYKELQEYAAEEGLDEDPNASQECIGAVEAMIADLKAAVAKAEGRTPDA